MFVPSYQVREASEADLVIIHDLAAKIWNKTYEPIISKEQIDYMFEWMYRLDALKNQLHLLGHSFFIIYKEEIAVGFASISQSSKAICRIHKLYILPELQGQKLGKSLLAYIEQFAKNAGANRIELNVNRYNSNAIEFYKKVGFSIIETVDIPLAEFMLNDYVMQREIAL